MEGRHTTVGGDIVCQHCYNAGRADSEPKIFYIHLNDGEVVTVAGVVDLRVTGTGVVMRRVGKPDVVYPRSRVYYACCESDCSPASSW